MSAFKLTKMALGRASGHCTYWWQHFGSLKDRKGTANFVRITCVTILSDNDENRHFKGQLNLSINPI